MQHNIGIVNKTTRFWLDKLTVLPAFRAKLLTKSAAVIVCFHQKIIQACDWYGRQDQTTEREILSVFRAFGLFCFNSTVQIQKMKGSCTMKNISV